MKTLYESIFDDNDIVNNADENIKKQLQEYLDLTDWQFSGVNITLGNPIKISIRDANISEAASYCIFNKPPMDIEYEYLKTMITFENWDKGYMPKIKHCNELRIDDDLKNFNKIKIGKLDAINVTSGELNIHKYMDNIIKYANNNKVKKFIFSSPQHGAFEESNFEKLSNVGTIIINGICLEGIELFMGHTAVIKNNTQGRLLSDNLNAYFDKNSKGKVIIKYRMFNEYVYFKIIRTNNYSIDYGYKLKQMTKTEYEKLI